MITFSGGCTPLKTIGKTYYCFRARVNILLNNMLNHQGTETSFQEQITDGTEQQQYTDGAEQQKYTDGAKHQQ